MGDSPKTGSEEFGDMLRRARERLGMSRRELAETTGLSYPYISQLETGYRMPSSPAMRSLADALGLRPDDLFDAIPPSSSRDEQGPPERSAPRPGRRRGGGPTTAGGASAAMPHAPAEVAAFAAMPAPALTSPVPAAGGASPAAKADVFGPHRGGWIDNEGYGSTASSDTGSGAPIVDALLVQGAAIAEPGPDPDLTVDEATALLIALPAGDRLTALGQVQDRVLRSVVEDRLRDAGRPD